MKVVGYGRCSTAEQASNGVSRGPARRAVGLATNSSGRMQNPFTGPVIESTIFKQNGYRSSRTEVTCLRTLNLRPYPTPMSSLDVV